MEKTELYWPKVMSLNEMLAFAGRDPEEKEKIKTRREDKRRKRRPLKM